MNHRRIQHNEAAVRAPHQRGVALITALLILAISTTAAVYLTNQHQLSIRRTGNVIIGNQAYIYALGGEALAMSFLYEDFKEDPSIDALNEIWAMETVPLPVEGGAGAIYGKITDLSSKFNVNNLINPDGSVDTTSVVRFHKLLAHFGMDPGMVDALVDWIDPDQTPTGPNGAEDNFYIGLTPPYRPPNTLMKSLSDLRLVRGFGEHENLERLMEHLTVLPGRTAININTASVAVLIGLGVEPVVAEAIAIQTGAMEDPLSNTGANANTAQATSSAGGNAANNNPLAAAIDQATSIEPFDSVADFMTTANPANNPDLKSDNLGVASAYFLYEGGAWLDRGRALLKSLLYRDNNGIMHVVMRSQGDL